ncbi:HNH endonuclease [Arsenicibacter rosenii]|uniref:HNH endonuclease n=1 Tax=Arsenicibacter rosenii TaxID=1750698 RepID=A0A1S2VIN3_9BACT|nr:HNH endonuclease signature motif containing protein [Arsenicibacter rosenii]OIN58621.1 HNH endonuclease [Arsenicibacter rosenii]
MSRSLSAAIKKKIALRAKYRCEYCLLPEHLSFYAFHIEHIRSIKHGGTNELSNLAYCCPDCNYFKGTDIATFLDNDTLVRFFNPRRDDWNSHFMLEESAIHGITDIGIATVRIFKFNDVERLIFRQQLAELGFYP